MDGHGFLRKVVSRAEAKVGILYAIIIVAGLFSPVILNDVVIVILTPVLIGYARKFKVDVAPLLVAEVATVNIASTLTPFGNPQNILLWSESGATIGQFVAGTWVPVVLSLAIATLALLPPALRIGPMKQDMKGPTSVRPGVYLAVVATAAVVLDLAGLPPAVSLGAGFVLGFPFTFRSLGRVFGGFDLRSLLTLYVFIGGVTLLSVVVSPMIALFVQPVASWSQPYSALFIGSVSNIISNVPATQLILNTVSIQAQVAPKIAVAAGLAGNIGPIGSFANLLALQMARRAGLSVRKTVLFQLAVGVVTFVPAML